MTHEQAGLIAAELIRELRGARSQKAFSRRLGYRSNIVYRWEAQQCFPTASTLFSSSVNSRPRLKRCFAAFFKREPEWVDASDPFSRASLAAFMREVRGKTPIGVLSERAGYNRYTVGRWLKGSAEPKLPEFLNLIEAASRRALDFVATLVDPEKMPSLREPYRALARARHAAYAFPWSHAVLRALELSEYRSAPGNGEQWIAGKLGLELACVREGLEILASAGQIQWADGRFQLTGVLSVDTSQDAERSGSLKQVWTRVALDRLQSGAPGHYGYSVFAVSRRDLRQLRAIHLEYIRAMQDVIARSTPGECVGLYCAQLLDLAVSDNALGPV